ncbi:hypothetical protein CHARACLAT_014127 [Characodon lateralis]|uniref:Uncharacterized protein n=1 Tax=Characodon lateralis TaxID=208331 RepID=A0ABU7CN07_9TELE|nr:hypothetical protein [Characodon lateralis]
MEWKPRGRRQLVFSLGVITLCCRKSWNLSGLRFHSCHVQRSLNSSLNTSAFSLLSTSNSKPSFSGVTLEHPSTCLSPLQPCQPQASVEKHLFYPGLAKNSNPRDRVCPPALVPV